MDVGQVDEVAHLLDSDDPHVLIDVDGTVTWANDAARRLIAADCVGRSWAEVAQAPTAPIEALLGDFRRSTSPVPTRMPIQGAAGDLGDAVSGHRLSARDPRVVLRVRRDSRRFGELTESLDQLNREIQRRQGVEEELSRVLNTTVLSLQRSNASLNEFAETVAHDLRSPLARIAGFAELVADTAELDDTSQGLLEKVQSAAAAAAELIESLLTEARTRARDSHLDVGLSEIVRWVRSMTDERAVQIRFAADLPTVRVAEQAVRQLMLNLVQNAAKHRTGPGPACVVVTAAQLDGTCSVTVADDGPGIPVASRAQVFERGWSTAPGDTSGLGLHLCRRIVQQHGGSIEVTDSPLGGCAFVFTLPVSAPAGAPD